MTQRLHIRSLSPSQGTAGQAAMISADGTVVEWGDVVAEGEERYSHHQESAASTWTIEHNLGFRPTILLFLDSSPDEPVYTDLTYPDDNTVVAEFPSAESGWGYAS